MRRYAALAADYDGTLAQDGKVHPTTVEALRRARAADLRLILVTGRQLPDLLVTFPETDLFDVIVAENGALLYTPSSGAERLLAGSPPPELLRGLSQRGVPLWPGRAIVATVRPHERDVNAVIRDLELPWHVVMNKNSVMALPSGVDKATGLTAALDVLGIALARTVGVGDAENDLAFMRACGRSVAVANALPEVKAEAHFVTSGACGAGVIEGLERILGGRFA